VLHPLSVSCKKWREKIDFYVLNNFSLISLQVNKVKNAWISLEKNIIKAIVIKRDAIWICNDSIFLSFSIRYLIMIRTMIFHNILEKYQSVITYVSVIITTGVRCRQVIILSHRNQKLVTIALRKKSILFSNRHFDVMSTKVISFR